MTILSLKQLRLHAKILMTPILMSLLLLPTVALAEVRIENGNIVMTAEDFRSLMGDIAEAEAERDALRDILNTERASQDQYMAEIDTLRHDFESERVEWRSKVKQAEQRSIWTGLIGIGLGAAIK